MARRRSKTLNQATDQLNRITDYYERTGRSDTARRIRRTAMDVGGTIGNMADRVAMRGGDPFTPQGMNMKVSYKDRTTSPSDFEYNAAVGAAERKRKEKEFESRLANRMSGENRKNNSIRAASYRAQRKAQGLSAG